MSFGFEGSDDRDVLLSELMNEYGEAVRNFAFTLTKRIDLADDITQDVFLKVYRKLDSYRGESSIKTWILAITRHVAFDYRRSAFFRRVTLVEHFINSGSHPSAEQEACSKMSMDDVWEKTLRIPQSLREALVLFAHHQLTYAEIAAILGISESAVKSRIHRARAKITALLREGESLES